MYAPLFAERVFLDPLRDAFRSDGGWTIETVSHYTNAMAQGFVAIAAISLSLAALTSPALAFTQNFTVDES